MKCSFSTGTEPILPKKRQGKVVRSSANICNLLQTPAMWPKPSKLLQSARFWAKTLRLHIACTPVSAPCNQKRETQGTSRESCDLLKKNGRKPQRISAVRRNWLLPKRLTIFADTRATMVTSFSFMNTIIKL